jgi:inosine-uridine nucleoside N-ribohydrolase
MKSLMSRRMVMSAGAAFCSVAPFSAFALPQQHSLNQPRARVIIDNDFGGDPDGLFQLAHFLMCESVAVSLIVGTHYKDFGEADLVPDKSNVSVRKAEEILSFFSKKDRPQVVAGSKTPIAPGTISRSDAAIAAIIQEAMRGDTTAPLFYAAGGSLTEIAQAWITEPKIGKRLRLLWIGGAEYSDLAAPPPGPGEAEYNFSLDRRAADIVFNQSDIEIWQVPRNAFRQMLVGLAEIEELAQIDPLGRYLYRQVLDAERRLAGHLPSFIYSSGETYALGDTALVTLAALQSAFQPDTSSSSYLVRPTPQLEEDGTYRQAPAG